MATLTKAQLVGNLSAKNMFTKSECAHIIETMLKLIKNHLKTVKMSS
jgi:nucleoid DNA-binding protein